MGEDSGISSDPAIDPLSVDAKLFHSLTQSVPGVRTGELVVREPRVSTGRRGWLGEQRNLEEKAPG